MRRAFDAARLGPERGTNPQVGCVLLDKAGNVLAVGHHRGSGTAHAEVDALSQVSPELARGATAVVSLEPCNHTGRTGPCAQALIAAGVARVVYSVSDPGDASSGGALTLRNAGVEVVGGVLEEEGAELLARWMRSARLGRPWVIAKWAQSVDGRAAAPDGTSQWITGPSARADVHLERSRADGIAVGTGTVFADDPRLTARGPQGDYADQPTPVVFGYRPIPADAQLRAGGRAVLTRDGRNLDADLASLVDDGIRTLYVEGGPTLTNAFLRAGLVDELHVYIAPLLIGGDGLAVRDLGVSTLNEAQKWSLESSIPLGEDIRLTLHRVKEEN